MPPFGETSPIHLTPVPVKTKLDVEPVALDHRNDPPLALLDETVVHVPE
jgi:hypothetical protein